MKKVISLFISITMLLCVASTANFSVSASVQTGKFGEYTYSFDDSIGVLRIGGKGSGDYIQSRPWDSYNLLVKTIIVENGTQVLCAGIFYNCPNLTYVSIPDTISQFWFELSFGVFKGSNNVSEVHYASSKVQWDTLNIPDWTLKNAILYCTDGKYHFNHNFASDSQYCLSGCGTVNPNYVVPTPTPTPNPEPTPTPTPTQPTTTPTTAAKPVAKPKSASIKKVKAAKKAISVEWKKVSGVNGYEIQVATDKKFKKNKKTTTVKKQKTTKVTVKKLKAKKKYYVRMRTYKTINGKKVYSSWSKVKTVKTK